MFVYIFSISLQLTWMEWWLMLRAVCWDSCCQWESGGSETMGWEAWDGSQYVQCVFVAKYYNNKERCSEWGMLRWRWASWGGNQQRPDFPRPKAPGQLLVSPFLYSEKEKTLQLEHQTEAKSLCANKQEKRQKPQLEGNPIPIGEKKKSSGSHIQLCHVCVTQTV